MPPGFSENPEQMLAFQKMNSQSSQHLDPTELQAFQSTYMTVEAQQQIEGVSPAQQIDNQSQLKQTEQKGKKVKTLGEVVIDKIKYQMMVDEENAEALKESLPLTYKEAKAEQKQLEIDANRSLLTGTKDKLKNDFFRTKKRAATRKLNEIQEERKKLLDSRKLQEEFREKNCPGSEKLLEDAQQAYLERYNQMAAEYKKLQAENDPANAERLAQLKVSLKSMPLSYGEEVSPESIYKKLRDFEPERNLSIAYVDRVQKNINVDNKADPNLPDTTQLPAQFRRDLLHYSRSPLTDEILRTEEDKKTVIKHQDNLFRLSNQHLYTKEEEPIIANAYTEESQHLYESVSQLATEAKKFFEVKDGVVTAKPDHLTRNYNKVAAFYSHVQIYGTVAEQIMKLDYFKSLPKEERTKFAAMVCTNDAIKGIITDAKMLIKYYALTYQTCQLESYNPVNNWGDRLKRYAKNLPGKVPGAIDDIKDDLKEFAQAKAVSNSDDYF